LCEAASGKTYNNVNPANEKELGPVADAGPEDMERAIQAAKKAFFETDWSTNHEKRYEILSKFAQGIKDSVEERFRPITMAEVGHTLTVTQSAGMDAPLEALDFVLDTLKSFQWSRTLPQTELHGTPCIREVWKEAAGVVAAITPWNFPMQINLNKVFPALAAGNTVILKPAPDTPWLATELGKVAHEVGLPAGVFNVITSQDPAEVGEVLISHPDVDLVTFTGSSAVGKHIMEVGAKSVKKVFLELGGKSANILLDDANFDIALMHGLAACFHAGQGCAIDTRMLVPKSRYEEAAATLTALFSTWPYGDPAEDETLMTGPIINKKQRDRIVNMIKQGEKEGATIACGGEIGEHEKGFYVKPTLLTNVTNEMSVAQEEIFGPVLCLIGYEDEEDAIRIANDSRYGLSGSIHSATNERALRVARRIRTGTLNINGASFFGPDAPFGGLKESGVGLEMGTEGFEEYLATKTVGYSGSLEK
jgi:aldehyde dehydrogenase (NAD+)